MLTQKKAKENFILISLLLLLVAVCTGGTLAYFTDEDEQDSYAVIDRHLNMELDIVLIEPQWESHGRYPDQGLQSFPGDNIAADPTLVNLEDPSYMRMQLTLLDRETREIITGERAMKIWSMLRYLAPLEAENPQIREHSMREAEMLTLPAYNGDWDYEENTYYEYGYDYLDGYSYDRERSIPEQGIKYFNFNRIINTGESAILYDHVIVPMDWDEEDLNQVGSFVVHMVGQALHNSDSLVWEMAFEIIHELTMEAEQ